MAQQQHQPFIPERRERVYRAASVTFVTLAIVALVLMLIHFRVIHLMLLAFAAGLIAVMLRGLSRLISRYTGWRCGISLAAVLLTVGGIIALGVWLGAPSISRQFNQLADQMPEAIENLKHYLGQYRWTKPLADRLPARDAASVGQAAPPDMLRRATGMASMAINVIAQAVIVVIAGVYLAWEPRVYTEGVAHLFPFRKRKRAREVMETTRMTLEWWLIGQGITMVIIGTLTYVGLRVLGIPLAFMLALLTALFNFVPNFGPLVGLIPACLLALTISPQKAAYVILLFIVAQSLEGYVITPLVQRRQVLLPPAVTLLTQLLMGWLLGAIGVMLAAPVAAVAIVVVKMLYVEDAREQPPGEDPKRVEPDQRAVDEKNKQRHPAE
jgi:predicted PurR-regulated permease PerM